MRTRILLVVGILGALVVAAFAGPLAVAAAESQTRAWTLTRVGDLQRFAGLADAYTTGGPVGLLFDEMTSYHELYGEPVAVVSTRGAAPLAAGTSLDDPRVAAAVERALRNEPRDPVDTLAPWSPDSLVFTLPIGSGAQVSGAVVILASTGATKRAIAGTTLAIGAGVAAALVAFGAFALLVSRWILLPLLSLSADVHALTASLPFRPGGRPEPPAGEDKERVNRGPTGASGPPELRDLSTSVAAMSVAVRTSAAAQRQLIADTAHQLRNPLAALQLRLDTLEALTRDDAAGQRAAHMSVAEAERLGGILDSLLTLAAAEAPRRAELSETRACTPWLVAADRTHFWDAAAGRAGISLLLEPDASGMAEAQFRAGDLAQILDVVFDNECKYARAGGTVRIAVARRADGAVAVVVDDDGPGVPAEDLPFLTQRFFRSESAEAGSGLGLSIAAALAEANGATLSLEASPTGGLRTMVTAAPTKPGEETPYHGDADA